jgi:hypothetical protein
MLIHCGCGLPFKRSGLRIHQRHSKNPLCYTKPTDDVEIVVDPLGDFFGTYSSYEINEDQMDINAEVDEGNDTQIDINTEEDEGDNTPIDSDSESDCDDEYEAALVEQENGLEPDRHQIPVQNPDCDMETSQEPPLRLRGGAETGLQKEPFVVKFRHPRAAAVYSRAGLDHNAAYAMDLGNSNNPYSPFSSKLEWELAYWDKIRGPSSNAFSELLKIEGVRHLVVYIENKLTNVTI